ncbi:MAG TPA: choice-of-anchor Q domain-containing protein [Verrucomicrobiae bacterium]|nr:choice-of-anchor Q domain-containing protein [Verrucomicrobiae bacterium]
MSGNIRLKKATRVIKGLSELAGLALALTGCFLAQFAVADGLITVTNSSDAGPGTLRQAIADSVSGDTIVFALDDTNTITLTNGQLLITNDLTIVSSNAMIAMDTGGNSRVLEISSSNTVVLDSLIITNGNVFDIGGGILVDNGATLTLTNCIVASNIAGAGGGIFISTNSAVAINNCIFSGNSATNNGGAIDNETNSTLAIIDSLLTGNSAQRGGAIFNNFSTNLLNHCTLSTNSAEDGGAIANFDSVLIATNLTVSANSAASGGGIFNLNNSLLALDSSILSGNTGTNFGGGLINTNGGTAAIINSTLFDNSCPADQGGGVDNWSVITVNNCTIAASTSGGGFVNNGGVAVCNNSTFSGNVALFDGGGFYAIFGTNILNNCTISGNSANRRAGGIYENNSLSLLTNTIVAGNTAVRSNANILGNISGANNLTNGDPLLAPLGNYGGLTQTMPPLTGSPAINVGVDSVTNLFTTDQRGFLRLASTHVDIGAVEVQPSLVINTNDDGPGSLRAIAAIAPPLIGFTNTLAGQTILLTSGQITLSNSVGIDASGLAGGVLIDASGASRVLEITASNVVTLDSLTITNGNVSDNGGGILVDAGVTLTLANSTVAGNVAEAGGGIFISTNSTVAINNCILSGNFATNNGGAIDNDTDSLLAVNSSTFSANSAGTTGGAIYNYLGSDTFNNCTFSNNASAADTGGGLCNVGSLTINTCTLDGNNPGGGVAQLSGILAINNSTVSHNTAIQSGGGFAIGGGQAALNNCTLFGNSTGGSGGGIAIYASATNMLNNCTVSGNAAGSGGGISQDPSSASVLTNTIVAGNTATNAADILGPFTGANNLTGGNPLLASFGNYGGPTQTMPPLAGSAAIDAGLDAAAASLITDQRGYPRQSGPHVDIGAVEGQLVPANKRPILRLSRTQPGGALNIAFTILPNIDFTVLSSTNVALPWTQWNILGPAAQNPSGRYQFTDPAPTNSQARFYQVVSP